MEAVDALTVGHATDGKIARRSIGATGDLEQTGRQALPTAGAQPRPNVPGQ